MDNIRFGVVTTFLLGVLAVTQNTFSGIEDAAVAPLARVPILKHANGHLTVYARLGSDADAQLVLDTAATRSMIADSLVRPHERRTFRTARLHGASGQASVKTVRIDALSIGDASIADLVVVHMNEETHPHAGAGIKGVLGMDFLGRFDVEIDLASMLLTLYASGRRPAGDSTLKLSLERIGEGIMTIDATLDGNDVTAVLDTGARRSIVNWAAARSVDVWPDQDGLQKTTPVHGAAAHTTHAVAYDFNEVTVGGTTMECPTIDIADLHVFRILGLAKTPTLILGGDLLEGRRFALDSGGDTVTFLN